MWTSKPRKSLPCIAAAASVIAWAVTSAFCIPSADQILTATGVQAGLCIHLGCGDGSVTVGLDNGGRIAVHGLAADDAAVTAARTAAKGAGKYGLVAIEKVTAWAPLPYADNLANLVVADLDALASLGLTEEEIMRVTAPEGVAYIGRGGVWTKKTKPRPAEIDDWTHWDYDATGNAVSRDRLVQPPTQLQWMEGYLGTHGSPGGGSALNTPPGHSIGYRIAGNRAVFGGMGKKPEENNKWWRTVRSADAFNGIRQWDAIVGDDRSRPDVVIATPERIYVTLGVRWTVEPGYLLGLDPATGQVAITYDKGIRFDKGPSGTTLLYSVVVAKGIIVEADSTEVVALDAATGALKWKKELTPFTALPTIAPDPGLVFVATITERRMRSGRNAKCRDVKQIVCFDLNTGAEKWRYDWPAGLTPVLTQLVYAQGSVLLFAADDAVMHALPKDAERDPILARLDAATGKEFWAGVYNSSSQADYGGFKRPGGSTSCRTLFLRDDKIYDALNWRYHTYDLTTGRETHMAPAGWERSHTWAGYGCEYQRATVNYTIISGGYVDKNDMVNRQFITRSTCATGFFPANGMIYCDDGGCNCWGQLRGQVAMSAEPVLEPAGDEGRLETTGSGATAGPSVAQNEPSGPVARGWHSNAYEDSLGETLATISAGAKTFVNDIHRHTITLTDGGSSWHFTAGARIGEQIAVSGGRVYLPGHDGWVYCLRESDGAFQWRFMAAPNDQKMVVCGQVESRWPVLGLAMHDGALAVLAGRHPEISGGIYVWGLDPATGGIRWKTRLHSPRVFLPAELAQSAHSNKMLGGELLSEGGQLKVLGTSLNRNRDGTVRVYTFGLDPTGWNGQTIDPKTQTAVVVRISRKELERLRNPGLRLGNGWFDLSHDTRVRVTLHDMAGRTVAVIFDGTARRGTTTFALNNALRLHRGPLILCLDTPRRRLTRRMLRL